MNEHVAPAGEPEAGSAPPVDTPDVPDVPGSETEHPQAAAAERAAEGLVGPEAARRVAHWLSDWERVKAEKDAGKERSKAEKVAKDADKERAKAEREAERERERAAKDAERERERAAKEAERAAKEAERVAEAEERYAKEEERLLAREEKRRAKRERTVIRKPEKVTVASTLRQYLWRIVMVPIGGVRVVGSWPEGPLVIVPNHTSHVDTAAMMAGAPTVMRVIPVAAADYWFRSPARAWIARRAIGAFPVERGGRGAYLNLRELLRPRVEESCSILIFAEGTRSPDGRVQRFKAGPARLARDFDIPLLPVAIVGAYDAFPKGGRLHYSPVELRIGEPVEPDDDVAAMTETARERIIEMLERGPAATPVSALYHRAHAWLGDWRSSLVFVAAGLGHTVIWPVPAESSIALLGVARGDRLWANVPAVAVGSMLGAGLVYALAHEGVRMPRFLSTSGSRTVVRRLVASGGLSQVFWRTVEGAPAAAVAEAAADLRLPAGRVLAAVGAGHVARSAVVVGALALGRRPVGRIVKQRYGAYLAGTSLVVAGWVGARAVRWWWRRR